MVNISDSDTISFSDEEAGFAINEEKLRKLPDRTRLRFESDLEGQLQLDRAVADKLAKDDRVQRSGEDIVANDNIENKNLTVYLQTGVLLKRGPRLTQTNT